MVAASFAGADAYRGTSDGLNRRITEDGNDRIIETPNAFEGTLTADGTRIAFAGSITVKNTGAWQVPTSYANDGGTWKAVASAYYFDSTIWKRIL